MPQYTVSIRNCSVAVAVIWNSQPASHRCAFVQTCKSLNPAFPARPVNFSAR